MAESGVIITIDTSCLDNIARLVKEGVNKGTKNVSDSLNKDITIKTPKKTGKLQKSWTIGGSLTGGFVIKNATPYLGFVINGTRPHIIKPKRHCLAFKFKGGQFFAKKVHHPGTKPNDFVGKTVNEYSSKIDNIIGKALRETGVVK